LDHGEEDIVRRKGPPTEADDANCGGNDDVEGHAILESPTHQYFTDHRSDPAPTAIACEGACPTLPRGRVRPRGRPLGFGTNDCGCSERQAWKSRSLPSTLSMS